MIGHDFIILGHLIVPLSCIYKPIKTYLLIVGNYLHYPIIMPGADPGGVLDSWIHDCVTAW